MSVLIRIIQRGDLILFDFINGKIKCTLLDSFFPLFTHLGGAVFTILLTLVFLTGPGSYMEAGILALGSLSMSSFLVFILKKIVERERPYNTIENMNVLIGPLRDYSFPSGHATASTAIAVSLGFVFPQISGILFSIAILVGISRIYIGVHYPSDVIVGMTIGSLFANLTYTLMLFYR